MYSDPEDVLRLRGDPGTAVTLNARSHPDGRNGELNQRNWSERRESHTRELGPKPSAWLLGYALKKWRRERELHPRHRGL